MTAEINTDIRTIQTGVYQLTHILYKITFIQIYIIIILKCSFIQGVEKESILIIPLEKLKQIPG